MAKNKYTIIDDQGNDKGFVVVETNPTFESVTPNGIMPHDGPLADSLLFLTVLFGITFTLWMFGTNGLLSAFIGVFLTCSLAAIKAWRGGLIGLEGKSEELTIKVETWEDNHVELEEIQDQTISLEDWRKVARAIVHEGANFSRPALAGCISQTCYHKVKDEFVRLHFAHRQGNNYILSPRALAFLRKVHHLPH